MVVAEPLYNFYNTEISLHFLHALVRCPAKVFKNVANTLCFFCRNS